MVKTLIEKKTAHYPNQKAPLLSLGNLPPGWEPMSYLKFVFVMLQGMKYRAIYLRRIKAYRR